MTQSVRQAVCFSLDGVLHALPLEQVTRVILSVEITPLPEEYPHYLGIINLHGAVVPVINIRGKLHLPERELQATDIMIIFQTSNQRILALVADDVISICKYSADDLKECLANTSAQKKEYTLVNEQYGLILMHNGDNLEPIANEGTL